MCACLCLDVLGPGVPDLQSCRWRQAWSHVLRRAAGSAPFRSRERLLAVTPRAGEIRESTNSWPYVPLLQAAARDLLSCVIACGRGRVGRPADWAARHGGPPGVLRWPPASALDCHSDRFRPEPPALPTVEGTPAPACSKGTKSQEQRWAGGTRFAELAAALRRAPGVPPATLLRLLRAAADCTNVEVGTLAAEPDGLDPATAQLSALPSDAPLPVSAAVLVCTAPDGYLSAPAQSALLEAYGGGALAAAAAAQALADDIRATFEPLRGPAHRRRRPRRSRRRRQADHHNGHASPADIDSDDAVPTCPPPAALTSDAAWEALDEVDLCEELRNPAPTLQDVPPFMRAAVRHALTSALTRLRAAHAAGQGTGPNASRAWKLFLLAPRMLLARPEQQGLQGQATLLARAAVFRRGEWRQLLAAARPGPRAREPPTELDPAEASERKRQRACAKVRQGELSRAR